MILIVIDTFGIVSKSLVRRLKDLEIVLYNSRGISVHALEFSLAENLSAQHMG